MREGRNSDSACGIASACALPGASAMTGIERGSPKKALSDGAAGTVAETFYIHKVLRPSGRKFVANQALATHEAAWDAVEKGPFSALPFISEAHSIEAREEVDAVGGDSQLDHLAGLEKVAAMKPEFPEPEGAQGRQDPVGVPLRRGDEEIEIAGESGSPVEGEAKGADHQVLNAMGVE